MSNKYSQQQATRSLHRNDQANYHNQEPGNRTKSKYSESENIRSKIMLMSWNCNTVQNKLSELMIFIVKHNISICALQELDTNPQHLNHKLDNSDYSLIWSSESPTPRYGFVIKKTFVYRVMSEVQHCFAIEFTFRSKQVVFFNYYRPHTVINWMDQFKRIADAATTAHRQGKIVILAGDMNARSLMWCDDETKEGELLGELVEDYQLTCINSIFEYNRPTHHWTDQQTSHHSCIDAAFTFDMSRVSMEIIDNLDSDHSALLISLFDKDIPPPSGSRDHVSRTPWRKLNPNSSMYDEYAQSLEVYLTGWRLIMERANANDDNQQSVEEMWTFVKECIWRAADITIGRRTQSKQAKHWWTPRVMECYVKMKAARKAYVKVSAQGERQARVLKNKTRNAFRQEVIIAKQESWKKLCNRLVGRNGKSVKWKVFHMLSGKKGTFDIPLPQTGPTTMEASSEYLKESYIRMAQTPDSVTLDHDSKRTIDDQFAMASNSTEHLRPHGVFTVTQLLTVMSRLPNDKAPGPDMITGILLKKGPPLLLRTLTALFNMCWTRGAIPLDFKTARIFSLYKNDGDRNDPASYRPISLTSIVGKLMERLVLNMLLFQVDNKLSVHQAGFRHGRSTLDQLIRLRHHLCVQPKNDAPVCFLDIRRAYDRVPIKLLLYKLWTQFQVTGELWRWIKEFLTNRKFQTIAGSVLSSFGELPNGVPQGSVISPILFDCFINDVLHNIDNCEGALFADDMVLWPHRYGKQAMLDINMALFRLNKWANNNAVEFNVSKSSVVIFSDKINRPSWKFTLGSGEVPIKDSYKYLGVIFQRDTESWKEHCEKMFVKLRQAQHMVLRVCHPWEEPNALVLKKLIDQFISPILSYGLPVWSITKYWASKFNSLLGYTSMRALGLPRGSSFPAAMIELGTMDVEHVWLRSVHQLVSRYDSAICPVNLSDELLAVRNGEVKSYHHLALQTIKSIPNQLRTLFNGHKGIVTIALREDQFARFLEAHPNYPLTKWVHAFGPQLYLRLDDRATATIRARLRAEVNTLMHSLHSRRIVEDDGCPFGCLKEEDEAVSETREHAILDCPSLFGESRKMRRMLQAIGINVLDQQQLLSLVLGDWEHIDSRVLRKVVNYTAEFLDALDANREEVDNTGNLHI